MREIWAQQGYEQEALRVYGKTDSGEDKGLWCDDCGGHCGFRALSPVSFLHSCALPLG